MNDDDDSGLYWVEDDEVWTEVCPACGHQQQADAAFIGQLGATMHFRCRYCGTNFAHEEDKS